MRPSRISGYGTQVLGHRHLKVVAWALDAANASSHALNQRRIIGADKALGNGCSVGALHSIDAKDLRRLRSPIKLTRRRLDDVIAVDDLERVDRGLTAHDTVERAVAHKHVDRMIDGLGRDERTSAIVNGDVFKARRHRVHAGTGRVLAGIAGIGKTDGRVIVKRVDGQAAHLGTALSRTHHHNVADLVATIERADEQAHKRTSRHIDELLATGVTKALAAATGNDHGAYGRHYAFPCFVPFMRYRECTRWQGC